MSRSAPSVSSASSSATPVNPITTGEITKQCISQVYHLPMKEASKKLGVSESSLRNICRKFNIERWPARKFSQLDQHIESLRTAATRAATPDSVRRSKDMIDNLQRARRILEQSPNMSLELAIVQASKAGANTPAEFVPTSQQQNARFTNFLNASSSPMSIPPSTSSQSAALQQHSPTPYGVPNMPLLPSMMSMKPHSTTSASSAPPLMQSPAVSPLSAMSTTSSASSSPVHSPVPMSPTQSSLQQQQHSQQQQTQQAAQHFQMPTSFFGPTTTRITIQQNAITPPKITYGAMAPVSFAPVNTTSGSGKQSPIGNVPQDSLSSHQTVASQQHPQILVSQQGTIFMQQRQHPSASLHHVLVPQMPPTQTYQSASTSNNAMLAQQLPQFSPHPFQYPPFSQFQDQPYYSQMNSSIHRSSSPPSHKHPQRHSLE